MKWATLFILGLTLSTFAFGQSEEEKAGYKLTRAVKMPQCDYDMLRAAQDGVAMAEANLKKVKSQLKLTYGDGWACEGSVMNCHKYETVFDADWALTYEDVNASMFHAGSVVVNSVNTGTQTDGAWIAPYKK